MDACHVAIIGSGSGGAQAAIASAQYGVKVALIEQRQLGGTCLHAGCIPVKSLLLNVKHNSDLEKVQGWSPSQPQGEALLANLMSSQRRSVAKLTEQLRKRLQKHSVEIIKGRAELLGDGKILVHTENSERQLKATTIIIATGSSPCKLPWLKEDGSIVGNSDQFVSLTELPQSIAIIGGGHIGCEFACIYAALGTEVTIFEKSHHLLNDLPQEAGAFLRRHFEHNGVRIVTDHPFTESRCKVENNGVSIQLMDGTSLFSQKLLIATGRKPNVEGIGLEKAGVSFNTAIEVDQHLRTSNPDIFAVGDVNGLLPVAHAAAAQAHIAVANAFGGNLVADFHYMPVCIYTAPEIATVGLTEASATEQGYPVITGCAHFVATPRAVAMESAQGYVKLFANQETGELLGCLIIGNHAGEMISLVTLALNLRAKVTDLANLSCPHPTFTEAVQEAARDALGRPMMSL